MELFLTKHMKNKRKVLLFFCSEDRFFTITELVEYLQISAKTCKHQLLMLTEELEGLTDQVRIISEKGRWRIIRRSTYPIQKIIITWALHGIPFKYISDLFFEKMINAETFAQQNYLSHSSYYKKRKEIHQYLILHKVEVLSKPKIHLCSSEAQIRYVYFKLFWDVYEGIPLFLKKKENEKITNFLRRIENIVEEPLDAFQKDQLAFWLALSVSRIKNKKHTKIMDRTVVDSKLVENIEKEYRFFLREYQLSEKDTIAEVNFLFTVFSLNPLMVDKRRDSLFLEYSIPKSGDFIRDKLFLQIEKYIPIDSHSVSKNPQIIAQMNKIYLESISFYPDDYLCTDNDNSFQNQLVRKKINQFIVDVIDENEKNRQIYEMKEFLSKKYADLLEDYVNWDFYIKKVKLKISIINSNCETKVLVSKLSHYFSEKVEILAFNSQERPDFTLTNYRGPNFQHSPSAGLYFIGEKLGKKDWNYLKQSIDSIFNRLNQKLIKFIED